MTAAALLANARDELRDVPQNGLGVVKVSRWRGTRIVRAGQAWHLGVLLLADDAVFETGEVLRAAAEVRRGYTAESARARADRRAQARRGGFAEGEIVHVDWHPIDVAAVDTGDASGPLVLVDGEPHVRWAPGASPVPLAGYLAERIALARG
ncbi:glutaminase [Microbacterium sp. Mu-80]|uniref:Glutaminase n=1 Tax=Microbacterium bandirmense TaxID=3122050 RepID=A0ABU8LDH5_9MICO